MSIRLSNYLLATSHTFLGFLCAIGAAIHPGTARAQQAPVQDAVSVAPGAEPQNSDSSYVFSVRPSVGVGIGKGGVGGRLGVAAEYWPSRFFGVGLLGATLGQVRNLPENSSATLIAPVVAFRSAPNRGYFLGTLGAGYARVKVVTNDFGLCLQSCEPERVSRYDAFTAQAAFGWMGHPGGSLFEIGPVARLDVIADPRGEARTNALVTLNLEIGLAIPES